MSAAVPEDVNVWTDAALAAALFAIDPVGIKGINLRAQPGPARDNWLKELHALLQDDMPWRRIPINIADSRLLGGLDLAATLQAGRPVAERGLLADANNGVILLAMAERLETGTAARLGSVIDSGEVILERDGLTRRTQTRFGTIALDEGINADEQVPASLSERLAFHIDLESVSYKQCEYWPYRKAMILNARQQLGTVQFDDSLLEVLCAVALGLGISSLRAPILAQRVARAAAALEGNTSVSEENIQLACRLVYSHRATAMPMQENDEQQAEPQQQEEQSESQQDDPTESQQENTAEEEPQKSQDLEQMEDLVLAASEAVLSKKLLEELSANVSNNNSRKPSGRSNMQKYSTLRGRPVGVRKGEPGNGARLNIIETLRTAAPWQRLRQLQRANDMNLQQNERRIFVEKEDFRISRFKQRTVTTTIFVVDASGSSAMHRLAETKGAIELLLAECYQRRDQVALIAFRGRSAEMILPPTRSLARAKRLLAGLPGGGATPLAAGIDGAMALSEQIKQRGEMPSIILLTDGRTNIARDGTADRPMAESDAINAAQQVSLMQISAMIIDTSPRAQEFNRQVATAMNAHYLALPHADAATLSNAILQQSSANA